MMTGELSPLSHQSGDPLMAWLRISKQRHRRLSLIGPIGYISPMAYTFRQLEIFVEAAVDCNFRRTADRLGITQPAISKQIRALERSVGTILFLRKRGAAAELSADGQLMIVGAQEILTKHRGWHSAQDGGPITLRVVTGDYLLDRFFKPALPEIADRYPSISLDFVVLNERGQILDQIRDGLADLAIYTGRPAPPEFSSAVIASISCSLYASPEIAEQLGDDPNAIANAPFILPSNSGTGSWILNVLAERGISPKNIIARSQFGDVLGDMVRRGSGVGLLFDDHVKERFGNTVARLNVDIAPAHRVIIFGAKALTEKAAPCVDFLRRLCSSD